MSTLTETTHPWDFLISEANGNRSRENVTLASGQNLAAGTVLGKITSGGKYVGQDNNASDGSQTALAILGAATDATAGDTVCAVIARDAEVNRDQLTYVGASPSAADTTAAEVSLALVGIIVR